MRRDDARDQVERDQPLGAGAVFVLGAIDREGDAHAAEDHLGLFARACMVSAGWRASHWA
jgi:hypothetical protein